MKQNFYLSVMAFTLIFILVGCTNNYRDGVSEYEAGNYEEALDYLYKISKEDKHYDDSQEMIAAIDSILAEQRLEQARLDSIEKVRLAEIERIHQDSIARTKHIGKWHFDLTPNMGQYTWIYNYDGKYKLKRNIYESGGEDEGTISIRELKFSNTPAGNKKFEDPASGALGEYYVIEDDGGLAVYDVDGYIRTGKNIE